MQKYRSLKDYGGLKHGETVYQNYWWSARFDADGTRKYSWRAGTVPGIRKWRGGPSCTSQRHYQQIKEHYSSSTLRLRLENWDVDYDRIRVNPAWLDPWDNEKWRGHTKNWKNNRKTQYRYTEINRHLHSPAFYS